MASYWNGLRRFFRSIVGCMGVLAFMRLCGMRAFVLHHSDRGCQYTCEAYQSFLAKHSIQVSMSRKGNCWDNAVVERFFGTLKRECTSRERFKTQEEARTTIFEYIEIFYNRVRKHSTLGYLTPVQFEIVHS